MAQDLDRVASGYKTEKSMETLKFMKDDWVREKGSDQMMQVDEYQIVEPAIQPNGNHSFATTRRVFSGKVWCTWINENKAVITQAFWEDDLEPAVYAGSAM
jgi:trans-2-enoyl-CoA reductase